MNIRSLTIALLLLGLLAWASSSIYSSYQTQEFVGQEARLSESLQSTALLALAIEPDNAGPVATGPKDGGESDPKSCKPLQEYLDGPEGYQLDTWFQSWGAPPIAGNRMPSKNYLDYAIPTLIDVAENGDAAAQHELGLSLVWSALTGDERPLADKTLFDLGTGDSSFAEAVDFDRLRIGRDWLYEAAVNGRTYALIDIATSFAQERRLRERLGTLSGADETALRILIYAYGEAVEALIPVWKGQFYSAPVPLDHVAEADKTLADIVAGIRQEMAARGVRLRAEDDSAVELLAFLKRCVQ